MRRQYSVVSVLIAVNAAVFVLCSLTAGPMGAPGSRIFGALALSTPAVQQGQIWRLVTSTYLHLDMMHIFFNMLGLYFFGRSLERDWGAKRFFAIYSIAGLTGGLFYVALTLIGWLELGGRVAGASGCVLGLVGVCAIRNPREQILMFPLAFSITVRTFALVFGGWYMINLLAGGPNAGGDACHLAGMGFGAWWAWRGEGWWNQLPTWRRPSFRTRLRNRHPADPTSPFQPVPKVDDATLDRVLKRVREQGVLGLTEAEKKILQTATEERRSRG